MGRKSVAGAPRNIRVDLCLTEEEKSRLLRKAAEQGLTVGQLVRRDVLGISVEK